MQGMPRYYGPGGGLMAAAGLGQAAPSAPVQTTPATSPGTGMSMSPVGTAMLVAGTAASGALAYHGYKRNNSVGWALAWFFLGGLFWPVGLGVAAAQGFGKPRVKANRRRKRSR